MRQIATAVSCNERYGQGNSLHITIYCGACVKKTLMLSIQPRLMIFSLNKGAAFCEQYDLPVDDDDENYTSGSS